MRRYECFLSTPSISVHLPLLYDAPAGNLPQACSLHYSAVRGARCIGINSQEPNLRKRGESMLTSMLFMPSVKLVSKRTSTGLDGRLSVLQDPRLDI